MERFVWINRMLWIAVLALGSYWVWSFFVSSRYQALCGASYWQMSAIERQSCSDIKSELDDKR